MPKQFDLTQDKPMLSYPHCNGHVNIGEPDPKTKRPQDDRKVLSLVVLDDNKVSVGDFVFDSRTIGMGGTLQQVGSGFIVGLDGYEIVELIDERKARGDWSFTDQHPSIQKVIGVRKRIEQPQIQYEGLGFAKPMI